jgi:predicted nucleic acid-binding protein
VIVIDSNVIVPLLITTEKSSISEKIIQKDPSWISAILVKSEVKSALTLYFRKGLISADSFTQLNYNLELILSKRLHETDSNLHLNSIISSNCSSYDCEFIALAQAFNCKLITWDKKIVSEFPQIAIKPEDFLMNY